MIGQEYEQLLSRKVEESHRQLILNFESNAMR
jgi:hypothetical protein